MEVFSKSRDRERVFRVAFSASLHGFCDDAPRGPPYVGKRRGLRADICLAFAPHRYHERGGNRLPLEGDMRDVRGGCRSGRCGGEISFRETLLWAGCSGRSLTSRERQEGWGQVVSKGGFGGKARTGKRTKTGAAQTWSKEEIGGVKPQWFTARGSSRGLFAILITYIRIYKEQDINPATKRESRMNRPESPGPVQHPSQTPETRMKLVPPTGHTYLGKSQTQEVVWHPHP